MTIVVGYEETARGTAALQAAATEARAHGQDLVIVRVLPVPPEESSPEFRRWSADLTAVRTDAAALESRLAGEGVQAEVDIHLSSAASPAGYLLDVAERVDAERIVIGLRSRSRVGKLLLGSVAQEVLLKARCSVLSVRA